MSNRNSYNCCANGCRNKQKESEFSFFSLPKEKKRRNEWLRKIGRTDLLKKTNIKNNSYRVCSEHFDNKMMSQVLVRKLLPGAVPSKCLPDPDEPEPSTSPCEDEPSNTDVSTQTMDSYVKMISVVKINNSSVIDVNIQAVRTENEQQAQTTQSPSSDTSRKRKLPNILQASEKKAKKD